MSYYEIKAKIEKLPFKWLRKMANNIFQQWWIGQKQKGTNTGTYIDVGGKQVKVNPASLLQKKGFLIKQRGTPWEVVKIRKDGPDETKMVKSYNYL